MFPLETDLAYTVWLWDTQRVSPYVPYRRKSDSADQSIYRENSLQFSLLQFSFCFHSLQKQACPRSGRPDHFVIVIGISIAAKKENSGLYAFLCSKIILKRKTARYRQRN